MIRRLLLGLAALVALLALALVVNTLRQGSQQITVAPLAAIEVDKEGAAQSLAAAVRARTVSGLLDPEGTAKAFAELHAHLKQRYPLVHTKLERELIGGATLVYTWRGSDANARPIALMAHQDVVPIAPGTEPSWKQPPFEGKIVGGEVWGRGAWDDKGNLVAQLEAVELLLKSGYVPKRTVYLIYGHDEEVGGLQGAAEVAKALKARGVKLHFVLDEGLLITDGVLAGISAPVALIGVAEKGYVSLRLSAEAPPGHSSMPPAAGQSAVGMIAAALAKLDATPVPGGIAGVAAGMFDALAPEFGLAQRVVLSNRWLFGPLVESMLSKQPATNAMLRTTTALTIVNAGNKDNVIPGRAEAVVNFRLLPGDTVDSVVAHVKKTIGDERIEVKPLGAGGSPASRVTSTETPAYRLVERTLREVFPGTIVAPGLMLAGTDSKHFEDVAESVFRFSPVRAKPQDLSRFHGTDERIAIDGLADMVRFYHRLVQQAADSSSTNTGTPS